MIGLRRVAPNRQGNPIPRTAKGQEYPLLRQNTKIVASWSRPIGQLNETYADLLRWRDKNSAMILRHDHNPAK
jgi:hypothetical protein